MSFTNFGTGHGHSFGGEYRELIANQRIRYSDKFDDPNMPGEMETTVTLTPVSCGTDLSVVQSGIPAAQAASPLLEQVLDQSLAKLARSALLIA